MILRSGYKHEYCYSYHIYNIFGGGFKKSQIGVLDRYVKILYSEIVLSSKEQGVIRMENLKYVKPIKKVETKKEKKSGKFTFFFIKVLLIVGVATAVAWKAADWGAGHQLVKQPIIAQELVLQLPYRVEEVKPEIVISPIVEKIQNEELSTIEQKIIDRWGIKEGVVAMAIAECESGKDEQGNFLTKRVSLTGDLGLFQINWHYNGDVIKDRLDYDPEDMFDVDKNIDAAYLVWDRTDGTEGDGKGSWGDGVSTGWTTFNTGAYLSCLAR